MTGGSALSRSTGRSTAPHAAAGQLRRAPSLLERLTRKRVVLLQVLLGAGLLLVTGSRVWVDGVLDDTVLGTRPVEGAGSAVAPGVVAAALVGAAAAVAAATSGRVMRVLASLVTVLAAVLGVVLVVGVLANPAAALGRSAAIGTGPTGPVAASGGLTGWPWAALSAAVAMGLGGLGALVGGVRWSGLSSRYDAPAVSAAQVGAGGGDGEAGSRAGGGEVGSGAGGGEAGSGAGDGEADPPQGVGRRRESAWEQLSRGDDPTRDGAGPDGLGPDGPTRDQ